MARVLVTYATRYGSTAEIASAVGEELTAAGFDADVIQAGPGIDVSKYDAVVAGAPAYGSKWLPPASVFLVANAQALSAKPLALFTAGMIGVKNPKWAKREHEQIVRDLEVAAPGISPVSTALFHGSFSRSRLPLCLRIMDMLAGTPQGDHRNWEAIRGWAQRTGQRFRDELEAAQPPATNGTSAAQGD